MNGYELSRKWFDWSFENPDRIKPIHSAIYFFAIEHCNRLGWKEKFGLPSQMVMEAIGVKNWRTYSQGLNELIDFGFIKLLEKSSNQYSSNIIAIVNFTKADTKALDKALQKHGTKQGQSIVSIDKQETKNNKQIYIPEFFEFLAYAVSQVKFINKEDVRLKYESWKVNDWSVTVNNKTRKIVNWKSTLLNTLPYLRKDESKSYTPNIVHE
jgi:hypothetical protein